MKRVLIRHNVQQYLEKYRGKKIYRQFPQPGYGFDSAFCIWYTTPKNSGKGCKLLAYSLEKLKIKIDKQRK